MRAMSIHVPVSRTYARGVLLTVLLPKNLRQSFLTLTSAMTNSIEWNCRSNGADVSVLIYTLCTTADHVTFFTAQELRKVGVEPML
jgi:hypothetical protein